MKRTATLLLAFCLFLPTLKAQSIQKSLTLDNAIHPGTIMAPGISALMARYRTATGSNTE